MPHIVQIDPGQGGVFVPNGVSAARDLVGVNDRGVEVTVREKGRVHCRTMKGEGAKSQKEAA